LIVGSGFLHPAYALQGDRTAEDLLATDLLAFDIKVFDPSVPVITSRGPDLRAGIALTDDDGDGTVDNDSELGWAGSDDVVLTPNDPGYARALAEAVAGTGQFSGTGAYVDLGWGRKLLAHRTAEDPALTGSENLWSAFSGLSLASRNVAGHGLTGAFTESLYHSGKVLRIDGRLAIMQMSYDTWSTHYEGDGSLQSFLTKDNLLYSGVLRLNGMQALYGTTNLTDDSLSIDGRAIMRGSTNTAWRRQAFDAGSDGIDNAFSLPGVDDASELETSPPFSLPLRGIQISVRIEDPATRQIGQMTVAREFVTN
jgi:hypothetical protein